MNRRRNTIVLVILTGLLIFLVPVSAHARGEFTLVGIGGVALDAILDVVFSLLDLVQRLVMGIISGIGKMLQGVINLKLSTGGTPIYTAWRILRDFCNMAFIVIIIITSFATIFGVFNISWLAPYNIHARGVISGFLFAAILLNFSLAIGQTVVETSNQAVKLILTVFPGDLGGSLATSVNLTTTSMGLAQLQPAPIVDNVDPALFAKMDPAVAAMFQRNLKLTDAVTKKAFTDCVRGNKDTLTGCYSKIVGEFLAKSEDKANAEYYAKLRAAVGPAALCALSLALCPFADQIFAAPADPAVRFQQILGVLFQIVLAFSFMLSMLVVFVFMLVRIPMVWVLLAASPIAWTSLAIPGARSRFDEWWKQFIAWNLFAPLYLFVIYLGMILIQKTAQETASLAAAGSDVPIFIGSLSTLFSYGMVTIVIIGGTTAVLKMSFLSGTAAGKLVGGVTGFLGFTPEGGAVGAAYRISGVQSRVSGATAGLKYRYENIPGIGPKALTKQREAIETSYRAQFGGAKLRQDEQRKKIQEFATKIKDEGQSVETMREKFDKLKDKGGAEAVALGRALLKEGELTDPKDVALLLKAAGNDTATQSIIRQEVARKAAEKAKNKEYSTSEAALEGYMSLENDAAGQKKFLENLRKNQPLEYSLIADKARLDGDAAKANDSLEQRASKLDPEDIAKVLALSNEGRLTPGANVNYRINSMAGKPEDIQKMRDAAASIKPSRPGIKSASTSVDEIVKKVKEESEKKELAKEERTAQSQEKAAAAGAVAGEREREMLRLQDEARAIEVGRRAEAAKNQGGGGATPAAAPAAAAPAPAAPATAAPAPRAAPTGSPRPAVPPAPPASARTGLPVSPAVGRTVDIAKKSGAPSATKPPVKK